MMRYRRLCPPPRCRVVIRPLLLRPAVLFLGSVSARSGVVLVISSNVGADIPRRPGEVGLYVLTGITRPRTGRAAGRLAMSRSPFSRIGCVQRIDPGGAP